MLDQSSFNLCSGQAMPRDIYYIIHAASDPVVALMISASTVTSELPSDSLASMLATVGMNTYVVSGVYVQVSLSVTLVVSPDGSRHTWPWLLESKHTLHIVAENLFARHRIDDGGLDTEEWQRSTTRFCRGHTSERSYDVGTSLCLPVGLYSVVSCKFQLDFEATYIHNMCLSLSNNFKVPLPDLSSNRLADRA
jgi:hypothetical protein